jgi:hypothetical protein
MSAAGEAQDRRSRRRAIASADAKLNHLGERFKEAAE